MMVFAIYQHESAIGKYVSPYPESPCHLLPTSSLQAVPECPGCLASCIKPTFVIHSTYGTLHVSVLFFQIKVQHLHLYVLQAYIVMWNPQLMRTALTALQSSELSRTLCVPIVGQLVLGKDPRKCINAPTLWKAEDNSLFSCCRCCLLSPLQA